MTSEQLINFGDYMKNKFVSYKNLKDILDIEGDDINKEMVTKTLFDGLLSFHQEDLDGFVDWKGLLKQLALKRTNTLSTIISNDDTNKTINYLTSSYGRYAKISDLDNIVRFDSNNLTNYPSYDYLDKYFLRNDSYTDPGETIQMDNYVSKSNISASLGAETYDDLNTTKMKSKLGITQLGNKLATNNISKIELSNMFGEMNFRNLNIFTIKDKLGISDTSIFVYSGKVAHAIGPGGKPINLPDGFDDPEHPVGLRDYLLKEVLEEICLNEGPDFEEINSIDDINHTTFLNYIDSLFNDMIAKDDFTNVLDLETLNETEFEKHIMVNADNRDYTSTESLKRTLGVTGELNSSNISQGLGAINDPKILYYFIRPSGDLRKDNFIGTINRDQYVLSNDYMLVNPDKPADGKYYTQVLNEDKYVDSTEFMAEYNDFSSDGYSVPKNIFLGKYLVYKPELFKTVKDNYVCLHEDTPSLNLSDFYTIEAKHDNDNDYDYTLIKIAHNAGKTIYICISKNFSFINNIFSDWTPESGEKPQSIKIEFENCIFENNDDSFYAFLNADRTTNYIIEEITFRNVRFSTHSPNATSLYRFLSASSDLTTSIKCFASSPKFNFYDFDTSITENFSEMFADTPVQSLDLSCFDFSYATDIVNMFKGCSSLSTLRLPRKYFLDNSGTPCLNCNDYLLFSLDSDSNFRSDGNDSLTFSSTFVNDDVVEITISHA